MKDPRFLNWGVLGTATIAMETVIPAIMSSGSGKVRAIASRVAARAREAVDRFGVEFGYTGYDALLDDPSIDAVYIPLPNHMHVPWAIKALEKGKHVLLEKPMALNALEAIKLIDASKRFPGLKIMEGFMYRFHPQWEKAVQLVSQGRLGKLHMVQGSFSFMEDDYGSIVNSKAYGGGSLMDVGCYPISVARFLFGDEPLSVSAQAAFDPVSGVDVLTQALLAFKTGYAQFFSGIRLFEEQRIALLGESGRLEFERPFNPYTTKPTPVRWEAGETSRILEFSPTNAYGKQIEAFTNAIQRDTPVPVPLIDGYRNMRVIDAIRKSIETGRTIALDAMEIMD